MSDTIEQNKEFHKAEIWYKKGVALLESGQCQEALNAFEESLKINPKEIKAWINKAAALGNLGQHQESLNSCEEIIKINPKEVNAWLNKTIALANLCQNQEALNACEETIKIDPKNAKARLTKWTILHNLGNQPQECLKALEEYLKIQPRNGIAWFNKGLILATSAQYQEALNAFDEAIKIDPKDVKSWYNKGILLGKLSQSQEALNAFEEVLKIDSTCVDALHNKGVMFGILGRHQDALNVFLEVIKLNLADTQTWFNVGSALNELGRYNDAILAFEESLKIDPQNAGAWLNKAVALRKLDKCQESLDALNECLKIDNSNIIAWANKGLVLGWLGYNQEALNAFEEVIKIDTRHAVAWRSKGVILFKSDCHQEALDALNESLKIDQRDALTWFVKAMVLSKLKQKKEALHALEASLEISPENEDAWLHKWSLLSDLNRHQEAINVSERILKTDEGVRKFYHLALLMFEDNQYEGSFNIFENISKIAKDNYLGYFGKGLWYLNHCNYTEAIKCFNEALIKLEGTKGSAIESVKLYIAWTMGLDAYKKEDLRTSREQFIRARSILTAELGELKETVFNPIFRSIEPYLTLLEKDPLLKDIFSHPKRLRERQDEIEKLSKEFHQELILLKEYNPDLILCALLYEMKEITCSLLLPPNSPGGIVISKTKTAIQKVGKNLETLRYDKIAIKEHLRILRNGRKLIEKNKSPTDELRKLAKLADGYGSHEMLHRTIAENISSIQSSLLKGKSEIKEEIQKVKDILENTFDILIEHKLLIPASSKTKKPKGKIHLSVLTTPQQELVYEAYRRWIDQAPHAPDKPKIYGLEGHYIFPVWPYRPPTNPFDSFYTAVSRLNKSCCATILQSPTSGRGGKGVWDVIFNPSEIFDNNDKFLDIEKSHQILKRYSKVEKIEFNGSFFKDLTKAYNLDATNIHTVLILAYCLFEKTGETEHYLNKEFITKNINLIYLRVKGFKTMLEGNQDIKRWQSYASEEIGRWLEKIKELIKKYIPKSSSGTAAKKWSSYTKGILRNLYNKRLKQLRQKIEENPSDEDIWAWLYEKEGWSREQTQAVQDMIKITNPQHLQEWDESKESPSNDDSILDDDR